MLKLSRITKRFPGVIALQDVDLEASAGEVVAIIGENGAGKSTLMKIIGGVYRPDDGTFELDGEAISLPSPSDALSRGIRVIYQELSTLDNLDIAGNIFLGRERRNGFLLDQAAMVEESRTILARVGLNKDPRTAVATLSIAERQLVEIARALSEEVRILILDEPTSSLTLEETSRLMRLVGELRDQGVCILYISHRLDEVRQIADRVVALRDGRNAGGLDRASITHEAMVRLMVGREIAQRTRQEAAAGPVRLRLRGFRTSRYPAEAIDLELRSGEIFTLAGLVGAGRTEVARALFGIDRYEGDVELDGKVVQIHDPADAIAVGIYLVSEDRRGLGLTVELGVRDNISLPNLKSFARNGLIDRSQERAYAATGVSKFGVKTASLETPVANLSGGNQQKVVLARWFSMNPQVLIVDEPTRGVDVGARADIYDHLRALAAEGAVILAISSDMEEVLAISDRIGVLHEGKLMGVLAGSEATEEAIMHLAVGS